MLPPNSVLWGIFVAYAVVLVAAASLAKEKSIQQRALSATVFLAVIGGFGGVIWPYARVVGFLAALIAAIAIGIWSLLERSRSTPT